MKFVALDSGYLSEQVIKSVEKIDGIDDFVFHQFPPGSKEEIIDRIHDADIVTSRLYLNYDKSIFKHTPKLKAIFNSSVGHDNISLDDAKAYGVKVFNCPGYNSNAVAEFAFALIISLIRKIPQAQSHVRANGSEYRIFEGTELNGKTLGMVGAGNVGSRIISIARGFGMNPIVTTLNPSRERAVKLGIERFYSLNNLLKTADIIVLTVPLTHKTKHLIGKQELEKMKKSAILVNIARQTIVDEFELANRLIQGKLAGAALDMVIEDPFQVDNYPMEIQEMICLPNVIVTPHIAAETIEANSTLENMFIENIERYLSGDVTHAVK